MGMEGIRLDCGTEIALRRSARARRMSLRVDRGSGEVTLTLPPGAGLADAQRFAAGQAAWLRRTLARACPARVVAAGAVLPVGGAGLVVTPADLRLCEVRGGALLVPQSRPVGPGVAAWLRERARGALSEAVGGCLDALPPRTGRRATALVLRDTRSRWGSCSATGRLMFSWRLAMAPPEVLAYVAAHEVAHLVRMDHSPAFWAVVERLHPGWQAQRAWLRENGAALLAWRFR